MCNVNILMMKFLGIEFVNNYLKEWNWLENFEYVEASLEVGF